MAGHAWTRMLAAGALALAAGQAALAAQATLTSAQLAAVVADSGSAVFDTAAGRLTLTELGSATMTGSDAFGAAAFGFEGLWLGSGGSGGQYLLQFDQPLAALSLDIISLSHLPEEGTESLGSFSSDGPLSVQASSADGSAHWTGSALLPTEEDGRATLTLAALSAAGFTQWGFVHNQPVSLGGFVVQEIRFESLSAVPEPATAALWLMGALALGARRWRAQNRSILPPGLRGEVMDSVSVGTAAASAARAG